MQDFIIIRGAREHNLKNLNIKIPRDCITVITGPSGSGKSSLAIDTIYAEGQRRYVESLSAYARQFLEQLRKPDVDFIEGLSPSIAIDQKTVSKNPRSTVGTITEIYDYMRVLYTRIGKPICYRCGSPIISQDVERIMSSVLSLPAGSRLQILSPIVRDRKGEYKKELQQMRAEGFVRARIDGQMTDLTQEVTLKKHHRHTIEVVIDRLIIKPHIERKLKAAIETALKYSDSVTINFPEEGRDLPISRTLACPVCGVSYPEMTPRLFSFNSKLGACPRCNGLGYEGAEDDAEGLYNRPCRSCRGLRLRKEALSVTVQETNIAEFSRMPVADAIVFIKGLNLSEREKIIASRILKEVKDRLLFLENVGLGYLSLDRSSITLSGGEAQRIRLATQMGSSLTGVLYVLDEPSLGLHPRDCTKLLKSLASVRDSGNTVIVVEHDEETIRWADHVIDMGPGGGINGGWITAEGSPAEIMEKENSITGRYLKGTYFIPVPEIRRLPDGFIEINGADAFNLKNIDVQIPLGVFTCVTGVSGSGKSTLVFEVLYNSLVHHLKSSSRPSGRFLGAPGKHRSIHGMDKIDRVICVEQSPLGRTPRSNPATYTGIFSLIRDLYSQIPEAKVRGYKSSRFSFNLTGGRCEACSGEGVKKVEMHFLPDVYVPCDVCKSKRYNRETLDIKYKGKNISDVLSMTVSEALEFFRPVPALRQRLEVIEDVGLGYIQLGQQAPTLSGGEAQRVRLSKELGKKPTGKTLYILDEPTVGLHPVDIEKLLNVLDSLVKRGNTVLVIEHNIDVIKFADYIIDMGPEGGYDGGRVVATGTPEEICGVVASHTGRYLRTKLFTPAMSAA